MLVQFGFAALKIFHHAAPPFAPPGLSAWLPRATFAYQLNKGENGECMPHK